MTATFEERFRRAAEAEGGEPVSAGARIAHVRTAVEAGRAFYVDLSGLPESERPAVMAEIKELVNRAVARVAERASSSVPESSPTNG